MNISLMLRVLIAVLVNRLFGKKTPVACHFSVTNRCPWRCSYCGFKDMHKRECLTEEALTIVRSLAKAGNQRLHLTGGEPALREDLGEIVGEAKRLGLFVTIATTGFNLKKHWERFKNIDLFFLSFDGPRDIHDAQRGSGAFDTLMAAMDFLAEQKKKFWTTTVLTSANIAHIDYILSTVKHHKSMANFHLVYTTNTSTYCDGSFHPFEFDTSLKVTDRQYREAVMYLLKRKQSDMKKVIGSSTGYLKALLDWNDLSQAYSSKLSPRYSCYAGKLYCYIDADGDVYPCGDAMGRVQGVSCRGAGFKKAFLSLPSSPCKSCIVACFNELNLMFSLKAGTILNWVFKV